MIGINLILSISKAILKMESVENPSMVCNFFVISMTVANNLQLKLENVICLRESQAFGL